MSEIQLDDINPAGIDQYPETASVKLHGPPGTGKTTQSAARVGRLIRDHGYDVSQVAWCTYRRSLAFDTLERFANWGLIDDRELRKPHEGATRYIGTIHAVANRTVGGVGDPVEFWHKKDFCDRLEIQFVSNEPWEDTPGKLLFNVFEWMNNNLLDPSNPSHVAECELESDLREHWNGDVPAAWRKWKDYKEERQIIDFYEMLKAPLEERLVPTTDVLVVDEYHDATPLMAQLCEYWIENADIAIVAGDPNQVVNAYDGADPRFFESLDLPKVLLDVTYRCPEEHWRAATKLLQKAHEVPPVERISTGQIVEYLSPRFEHGRESGWNVPGATSEGSPGSIVKQYGDDTLFLTRMQMQADGVGYALERAGVIYKSQADLHGWNTDRGARRLAVYNALQKIRGFAPGHFGRGGGLANFGDAPRSIEGTEFTTAEAVELLRHTHAKYLAQTRAETKGTIKSIENREQTPTVEEFNEWVETEFWTTHTAGPGSVDRLNKGRLKDRDRMALKEALKRHTEPVDPDSVKVSVLTIHASKGQEAEDVVVYDGISQRITKGMRAKDRTRENEWRTWYVALTRASKRLHIMRGGFDWTRRVIPENIRGMAAEPADD